MTPQPLYLSRQYEVLKCRLVIVQLQNKPKSSESFRDLSYFKKNHQKTREKQVLGQAWQTGEILWDCFFLQAKINEI